MRSSDGVVLGRSGRLLNGRVRWRGSWIWRISGPGLPALCAAFVSARVSDTALSVDSECSGCTNADHLTDAAERGRYAIRP